VPQGIPVSATLDGYAEGSFTLEVEEIDGYDRVTSSTTFSGVPSSPNTKARIDFPDGTLMHATPLSVDLDGNGTVEISIQPRFGQVVIPDLVSPDVQIGYSVVSGMMDITGIDTQSAAIATITPKEIRVVDSWGNSLVIPLEHYSQKMSAREGSVSITFSKLIYNGVANSIPTVRMKFIWEKKDGQISKFSSLVKFGDSIIASRYSPRKNETTVVSISTPKKRYIELDLDRDDILEQGRTIDRLAGLQILSIRTNSGLIEMVK
jgi:hypothetical protein